MPTQLGQINIALADAGSYVLPVVTSMGSVEA